MLGAKLLVHCSNTTVRRIFLPVLALLAVEMLLRGIGVA
jgi:uncharacterized membrane protein YfcA